MTHGINVTLYKAGCGRLRFKAAVDLLDDVIDHADGDISYEGTFSTPGAALRDAARRIDNHLTLFAFNEFANGGHLKLPKRKKKTDRVP
jgi:hypothetical protein